MERRNSKCVKVGSLCIGGDAPVTVQSMTNTDTADARATLEQINKLEAAGCDIIRFTVNSAQAAKNIAYFKQNSTAVLVADIHFDYKLALMSCDAGIDKVRINPGNIGSSDRVREVCRRCSAAGVPIRIGVNSGSLEREVLAKYGAPTAEALAESAENAVNELARHDFGDVVVSIKSSDVKTMIDANRIFAQKCNNPLHLGVTEAGHGMAAYLKSGAGIGALLADGIGDTIRISLTDDPVQEVYAAKQLLKSLGYAGGIEVISCPTCGRTRINLIELSRSLEAALSSIHTQKLIKVALMGCAVNGPGEAREADVGAAGGDGEALIFKKGVPQYKVAENDIVSTLVKEVSNLV